MSSSETDGKGAETRADRVPAWLEVFVPVAILALSLVYVFDIHDIPRPEQNLLMLMPLMIVVFALLALIGVTFVWPAVRSRQSRSGTNSALSGGLAERDEQGGDRGRLLMVLLAVYAAAVFSTNYIAATFIFICVTAWLMGMRSKIGIAIMAILTPALLYLSATGILHVRF